MRRLRALLVLNLMLLAAHTARGQETHWAFVPPKRPAVAVLSDSGWAQNSIDCFVLEALDEFDLKPAARAERDVLLRRLSFDLTGLPPTRDERAAFLSDARPDAYERLVDRLLASPAYGERLAQRWLDLARYADTDGYEFDAVRPEAWRYRDWVVRALNADMPYDRFIRLQLAGDEIAPYDSDALIATGFNRCYPDMVDQNDQALRRQSALNDITETTSLVFMGLTLGCARCHDHKTDPVPQADFYRLQAFFTPARFRDDLPVNDPDGFAAHRLQMERWEAQIADLQGQIDRASGKEREKLRRSLEQLKKNRQPAPPHARGLDEKAGPIEPTFLLVRGDFTNRGRQVEPGYLSVLAPGDATIASRPASSGRRTALSNWLTDPRHPLTSRVIVNRLWQHYFGRGLVATASDFGLAGEAPSHPELLDWLAFELVDRGWSLKAIQRLIVTSATYRQASTHNALAAEFDPENTLLWRHARRRLDGEALRDALLFASGRLRRRMGGPGVFPELPQEIAKLNAQGIAWPVSPDRADHEVRSLYIFVRRNLRFPFFEAFDRPDTNASCPQRPSTTTAPQALSLLNGNVAHEAALATAARLDAEAPADRAGRIAWAFETILGRAATPEDLALADKLLGSDERWADLCLALFNVNAFLYVD